jgi:hypothetical protein
MEAVLAESRELLRTLDEPGSPKSGAGGSEHCVAVYTRKARILYIYKSKRKLK